MRGCSSSAEQSAFNRPDGVQLPAPSPRINTRKLYDFSNFSYNGGCNNHDITTYFFINEMKNVIDGIYTIVGHKENAEIYAGNDQIWVSDYDDTHSRMSKKEKKHMKEMLWFKDTKEGINYWSYFTHVKEWKH